MMLLGVPGLTTSNKKLLGAPGIATRSMDATNGVPGTLTLGSCSDPSGTGPPTGANRTRPGAELEHSDDLRDPRNLDVHIQIVPQPWGLTQFGQRTHLRRDLTPRSELHGRRLGHQDTRRGVHRLLEVECPKSTSGRSWYRLVGPHFYWIATSNKVHRY